MKTLQSILNSPERRLSAEEMKEIKGGSTKCYCKYTSGDQYVYGVMQGTGTCSRAQEILESYYGDVWDEIKCGNF